MTRGDTFGKKGGKGIKGFRSNKTFQISHDYVIENAHRQHFWLKLSTHEHFQITLSF